jgi:Ca-activated chloride channel family protein
MNGVPLDLCKAVLRETLKRIRARDKFNVVVFSGAAGRLWDLPRDATADNVRTALSYIETLRGGGGTEMMEGLRRALEAVHDPAHLQMYVFMTDGHIGEEADILRTVREHAGRAAFFAFGAGSSVNRRLLDGISFEGRGATFYANARDASEIPATVRRFYRMIDAPVLAMARIEWNGLPVTEALASGSEDLYAGQVYQVVGRYSGPARGTAHLVGIFEGKEVRFPIEVDFPASVDGHEALAPLWARWKVHDLSSRLLQAPVQRSDALVQEITRLGVEFSLATPYTSFVAVDEAVRVVGESVRVIQPVEFPEGMNRATTLGEGR